MNQQIPWCCASAARTRRSIKRQCPGHNLHWLVMLLSNLSNLSFRMWESCMDMSSYHVIYLQSSLCCLVLAQKLEGAIYFEWKHCWERMSSSLKIWNFCLFGPSSCGHHNTKSWLLSTSWLDARRHTHGCWLAEVMLVQGLVEDVYKQRLSRQACLMQKACQTFEWLTVTIPEIDEHIVWYLLILCIYTYIKCNDRKCICVYCY